MVVSGTKLPQRRGRVVLKSPIGLTKMLLSFTIYLRVWVRSVFLPIK